MPLAIEVGLEPGQILLDANPALPKKKGHSSPHFCAFDYFDQTAVGLWIKMSFGAEVTIGQATLC